MYYFTTTGDGEVKTVEDKMFAQLRLYRNLIVLSGQKIKGYVKRTATA